MKKLVPLILLSILIITPIFSLKIQIQDMKN